mmetsp:Transcript_33395/g.70197  ORF Transcript_33395/g.70197 Transcript_33395/m.70197 type:complete len:151 (+) Transcript_33395:141-593(+)
MSNTGVKTDEKKQHFDDIYVEPTPVPYKTRILDALDYVSDDFNLQMFDAHILPWARTVTAHGTSVSKSAAAAGFKVGNGKKTQFRRSLLLFWEYYHGYHLRHALRSHSRELVGRNQVPHNPGHASDSGECYGDRYLAAGVRLWHQRGIVR